MIGLLAGVMMAACATTAATTDTGAGSEGSLTVFQASDIDGNTFDLGEHLGRDVVLMSFWATYCEPCKTEMPFLQKLHDTYRGQGLRVLSISLDGPETQAGVPPYIKSNGYTFPVVVDEDTSIALAYNPRSSAPFTVLIDREGRIAKTIEGFQLSEAELLEKDVKHLLEGRSL